jgi:flagellar biosynthesis/type III secretory pathway protein FliH
MSSEAISRGGGVMQAEPFLYVPSGDAGEPGGEEPGNPWGVLGSAAKAQIEKREREAFARGLQEGESRARIAFDAKAATIQQGVGRALAEFQKEREEYFIRIEPEVVQLALAIARKILHREAQIDPLLLTGLVHVALEKLDAGTHVRLRANPVDMHFWNEHFAQSGSGVAAPELIGDSTLQHGECSLETEVGSTQISLETQLKEIEQGFFDLLEQRPRIR